MDLNQNQVPQPNAVNFAQQAAQIPNMQNFSIPNMPNVPNMPAFNIPTQPPIPNQSNGPIVFNSDELTEMNNIREAYDQLTIGLGQIEMQKREIAKNEKRTLERLTSVEAQEKVFLDKIIAKYGEGTFDINTGVFTPKQ